MINQQLGHWLSHDETIFCLGRLPDGPTRRSEQQQCQSRPAGQIKESGNNGFVLARKMIHAAFEMKTALNGNGNGNGQGAPILLRELKKKAIKMQVKPSSAVKESHVTFLTNEGVELTGMVARVTRRAVFFELYNPETTPRFSETLEEFKIILHGQQIYAGRATLRNAVDAGNKVICEATLRESDWADLSQAPGLPGKDAIGTEFKSFFNEWQKLYKISSEFKVVIADMQAFFHDLRLWLEKAELGIRNVDAARHRILEKEAVAKLAPPIIDVINVFIRRFEGIVSKLADEEHPNYYVHLRRQLHPLVLVSPFAQRAFYKPLGYAGDYLMVDMMIRPPEEGDTLFAKIINIWLLGQVPAQAHRNRVEHLERRLIEQTSRVRHAGRTAKIFNLGCGPAAEIQRFLGRPDICSHADLTLVDFNEETLLHLSQKIEALNARLPRPVAYRMVKKSVNQILKEAGRLPLREKNKYDYIYCAGLFDYLSDQACKQLMNVFYEMLAPGGLLLATNATDVLNDAKPFRFSMEYLLDWHLIYRSKDQFAVVAPDLASQEDIQILVEDTGANLFLEVKKPANG